MALAAAVALVAAAASAPALPVQVPPDVAGRLAALRGQPLGVPGCVLSVPPSSAPNTFAMVTTAAHGEGPLLEAWVSTARADMYHRTRWRRMEWGARAVPSRVTPEQVAWWAPV